MNYEKLILRSYVDGKKKTLAGVAATTSIPAILGAAAYGIVGGAGIAIGGTAIGLGLGTFMAIPATLGLVGYSIYRLGKKNSHK